MQINNIFSALVRERTTGVIVEFILWILSCVVIVTSIIASIIGNGNLTWILLMVFSIGLAILLAFRLKGIVMIYSTCCFYFIMGLVHYIKFRIPIGEVVTNSVLNIIIFIFIIILSIALITLQCIQGFTKMDIGLILTILIFAADALLIFLHFMTFFMPTLQNDSLLWYSSDWHSYLNYRGYWIGTISYWLILVDVSVLYGFSFLGNMDPKRGKILSGSFGNASIQCIAGSYQGSRFSLQNGLFVIGSAPGVTLRIPDRYVSGRHCSIRFNTATGCYEIMDESSNGTFLSNGIRLKKGVFNAVQRGNVICIGSFAQQFKLL